MLSSTTAEIHTCILAYRYIRYSSLKLPSLIGSVILAVVLRLECAKAPEVAHVWM